MDPADINSLADHFQDKNSYRKASIRRKPLPTPVHFQDKNSYQNGSIPRKPLPTPVPFQDEYSYRNGSIPRKPLPPTAANYERRPLPTPPLLSRSVSSSTQSSTEVPLKDELRPTTKYGWRFYGTFGCLCLINLVCAIDAIILSVALPSIAQSLNGTAIEAFWAGTSFLLTSTVFQPVWAAFSHILGRKSVLLAALFLFTLGTIICGVSPNFTVLLAGRSVQGIGGGGLSALTYVIVSDLVTLRERGKWFSVISLQWAIGAIIAPVIGGAIAEHNVWPWIFWLNLPICGIAFIGIPICFRLAPLQGSVVEKLKNFDWIGSFLLIAAVTSILIPVTWGGVMYDWNDWQTLVPLILGFVTVIIFALYSKYVAKDPVVRGSIFSTSTAKMGYFGTFIHGLILWAMLYYLPLYYQVAKDLSPVQSGVALFPNTFTTAPAAVIVGLVIAKSGKYRPSMFIGWFLTTLGTGLLILLAHYTTTPQWIFIALIPGVGMGILYSAQSFAVQASASNADLPFAAAMYSFFRAFGQCFGIAVGGVVFQNTLLNRLAANANPFIADNAVSFSRDASALVEIIKAMPAGQVKTDIVEAYVQSLKVVWIVMCALAAVTFVMSLVFVKDISLDRELETAQGFIHEKRAPDAES